MDEQKIGSDFLTDEQRSSVATAKFLADKATKNISSGSLSDEEELQVPDAPQSTDYTGVVDQQIAGLQQGVADLDSQVAGTEAESDELRSQLLQSLEVLGTEKAKTQELEQQAGLDIQRKELQNVINELQTLQKEASAIPLAIQEEFAGRGVTAGGVEPIQTSRLRQNAIKSLSLSAIGQTLQGNISLAEQTIQRAIDAEFEPERQKLQILGQLYQFNREDLERVDKKRADAMGIMLAERERLLGIEEANKAEIYSIGRIASQFGAGTQLVQSVFKAKTKEEAVALAGQYLQDPMAKQALANAKLDNQIKQAQLNKIAKETQLLGVEQQTEIAKQMSNKDTAIQAGEDLVTTLELLKTHKGITRAVGAYGIARFTPFQIDKTAVNDFTATVDQITKNMTLQKLLDVKAQGGTFGALSEKELELLADSATKINNWRRKRDDGSVYYEIGEEAFITELNYIITKTNEAIQRQRGGILSPTEQSQLDDFYGDQTTQPMDYFNFTSSTQTTNF